MYEYIRNIEFNLTQIRMHADVSRDLRLPLGQRQGPSY